MKVRCAAWDEFDGVFRGGRSPETLRVKFLREVNRKIRREAFSCAVHTLVSVFFVWKDASQGSLEQLCCFVKEDGRCHPFTDIPETQLWPLHLCSKIPSFMST